MLTLPVHRIIPFSNVEGIGNRTSIFVQGCNMNCIYCHNSETIPMKSEEATNMNVEELLSLIRNNMPFIRGITVSGGEATIYYKFLTSLFNEVHKLGITCYIDTNGIIDKKRHAGLIEVTDKFLFDIKGDEASLEKLCFTGSTAKLKNKRFNFDNLNYLLSLNKVEEIRLVYLKNMFDDEKIITDIANSMKGYEDVLFKLIRVHTRGLPEDRIAKLKGHIPSIKDVNAIEKLAKEKGIHNIVTIM